VNRSYRAARALAARCGHRDWYNALVPEVGAVPTRKSKRRLLRELDERGLLDVPEPVEEENGQWRLDFLHKMLEELREQTEFERGQRVQTGITHSRYDRALDHAEKVLIDYADIIKAPRPWPPIVLLAMDMLGVDTDEDGWAPHTERAERMGW
jgi:hypothetical protein